MFHAVARIERSAMVKGQRRRREIPLHDAARTASTSPEPCVERRGRHGLRRLKLCEFREERLQFVM